MGVGLQGFVTDPVRSLGMVGVLRLVSAPLMLHSPPQTVLGYSHCVSLVRRGQAWAE